MKKIYYNGTILTMEPELYAQAVLTNRDHIEKVGNLDELRALAPDAEEINLNHNTMLPAFIDAHGHFSSYANAQLQISLEEVASWDEIEERVVRFLTTNRLAPEEWVVAKGYDHNTLTEKCHPTLRFLNRISPKNPLILQHQSGHCGVLNTKALDLLGITADTPSPKGGIIGCEAGKLTGYMEEEAYIQCIKKVPIADFHTMLDAYGKAQQKYLSYGITTVQEGMMVAQMLPLYKSLLESDLLRLDVVGYSELSSMEEISKAFPNSLKKYHRHFKIGGYKIFLDGSPQVKTAWMKSPYQGSEDHFGYGTMSDSAVFEAVEKSAVNQIQILAHCNGDAAIQQYINAIKKVAIENRAMANLKPVIIHSQLISKEELKEVAKLSIIPSFFVAHVFHWGDVHIENFGYERASFISPANSALRNDIVFTFHQDAPVIEPNMLETIQCAVTRRTKKGVLLGKEESISPLEALKAVTINAAYQYSEEERKGSIKEGKCADFVIMNANPLEIARDKIKDISILETIKDGQTLFQAPYPFQ